MSYLKNIKDVIIKNILKNYRELIEMETHFYILFALYFIKEY